MIIRIAGFGGQGIVMAGYLLGHAGVMDGRNALQTQTYGSESRGGASKSDVIISDGEILELVPSTLDVLVAMSQPALDKHLQSLENDGILIYDSDLVKIQGNRPRAFGLPATALAEKIFERDVVANVIVLGYLVGLTGAVTRESIKKVIAGSVPPKTKEMNDKAFEEGFSRGTESRAGEGHSAGFDKKRKE